MYETSFVGYTIGLDAVAPDGITTLVKVMIERESGAGYVLTAVSGHNLARLPFPVARLTQQKYDEIPSDPYANVPRARAMLALLGFRVSADSGYINIDEDAWARVTSSPIM